MQRNKLCVLSRIFHFQPLLLLAVWWWLFELAIPWRQCTSRAFHSPGSCAELFLHVQALVLSSYAGEFQREMLSRIQVQGRGGAHVCWCHWSKSLGNRWSCEPQGCRHRNVLPAQQGGRAVPGNGLCPQLPSQGPFLERNNCQGMHCRRFFLNKFC